LRIEGDNTMNKTAIKNFAVWARRKLIADISYRAGLMGITEDGIKDALPQSTGTTEFYDIGTAEPYSIRGAEVQQRKRLVEVIRKKEADTDYKTAYQYIMEEVAYTWFNRLIAVRFMEVNEYLPSRIRVLSSETVKVEPDLVTTPFDADLPFTEEEIAKIYGLKDKADKESSDELFSMLFIKQCNALNEILPNLFEKTSDYTELLLNLSVIDEEGVVYHLVHDIEEKDFNVELEGQVEIIGWLYQYYNTEPKDAVFGRPSGQKIKKEEIPAATQLFTPDWIVRYMVENSLGRLWVEGHPNDELKATWKYYLEEAPQEPAVQEKLTQIRREYKNLNPEDIKVIDPCMGSGHILVYAFDVLMQIYEAQGYSQRDAAQSILRYNLHGLDIDERACQLAYFSVMMKARQYDRRILTRNIQPMVYATTGDEEGENFGSLVLVDDPGEMPEDPQNLFDLSDYAKRINVWNYRCLLAQKYDVVVTNPPYMGGAGMNAKLAEFVKKNYSDTKSDMSTVFMEKTISMCKDTGYMAMINIPVWMFLSSYEKLRNQMLANNTIVNMVHPGRGIFGSDFGAVTFVIGKNHVTGYKGQYRRLFDKQGEVKSVEEREQAFLNGVGKFTAQQDNFSKIPGSPVAYWVSSKTFELFTGKHLDDFFDSRVGLMTTDNDRFLRLFWEVSRTNICFNACNDADCQLSKKRWFPHNKGGSYRKWAGNRDYVVDWENNGERIKKTAIQKYPYLKGNPNFVVHDDGYYFRENISWSEIAVGNRAFRYFPSGFTFNVKGMSTFPKSSYSLYDLLGFANTKVATYLAHIINPSISFGVNSFSSLPFIPADKTAENIAKENIKLSTIDWDSFETSWDFQRHPLALLPQQKKEAEESQFVKSRMEKLGSLQWHYEQWKQECEERFAQLKANEEELNRIFIDIYGLQDELTPEVEDKDVTVRKANLQREIKSLLSYAVGCMFGRYSLDVDGLAYAGGEWDNSKYTTFLPDEDNVIPITDEEYLEDDIVGLLCAWLKKVYGAETLEKNLDFIAAALGNKGNTSREIIRNYFLTDFFKDHCKTYQKRPIYWLFDSGKQNGFKALIYLHRYTPDTIGNLRIDYLHRMQRIYESEMNRMQDTIDNSTNTREVAAATKRKEKLAKQLKECREYDEKISHLALSRITLDLDDGVKVNYEKLQTASDGKKYQVLAKI
jgi:hypothetical protein